MIFLNEEENSKFPRYSWRKHIGEIENIKYISLKGRNMESKWAKLSTQEEEVFQNKPKDIRNNIKDNSRS